MLSFKALNAFAMTVTDIIFFSVLGVIVVLCVAVYFLIPVINKKQYKEQRETLKKREAAFKSNIMRTDGAPETEGEPLETADESIASPEDAPSDGPEEDEKK